MKKILSYLLSFGFVCLSLITFTGCTHKTYTLAGVVNEETGTVTPISEVDEETKSYIADTLGENPTIRLKENGEFIIKYTLVEAGLEITYKQTGTYKINEDERTITFSFPKANGSGTTETIHQYEDGKIVYFDGVNFLLFN